MSVAPLASSARAFFEHIRAQPDRFAYLSAIPSTFGTDPFFETDWLDFKSNPHTDDKTKEIWSKALSGFANITDGIIVWGILANKAGPNKIDAAHSLRLIPDAHGFESRLRELHRDATNPLVMNVDYQTCTNAAGDGFVVCLIPVSRFRPHRAEFADKQYYYRAGDSFRIAEPNLLRMLFYPQSRPYMRVEVKLLFQPVDSGAWQDYQRSQLSSVYNRVVKSTSTVGLTMFLHNTGTATAKDVYVVLKTPQYELNYHNGPDWNLGPNPQGNAAFQARRSFHPGESTELCASTIQTSFPHKAVEMGSDYAALRDERIGPDFQPIVPYFDKITLQFLIYAEGAARQEMEVTFSPKELSYTARGTTKDAVQVA